MSSSPEPRHAAALEPVLRGALARHRTAVVLIDGRSGSGKSTFAERLAAGAGARLLRLEDCYPGWDGLAAAARALVADVLVPRTAGGAGRMDGWDWANSARIRGAVIPPDAPLVVEGCGALSAASARFADLTVWTELDAVTRRRRALDRDGDTYAPHWQRWAAQEAAFIARERPRALADLVLDGRTVRSVSVQPAHRSHSVLFAS